MKDPRLAQLADVLLSHSVKLQKGEKVLIETFDIPDTFIAALVKKATEMGGIPVTSIKRSQIMRELYKNLDADGLKMIGQVERSRMEQMDAYIGVRGSNNVNELAGIDDNQMQLVQEYWSKPVHFEVRIPKTRWVVLRYPNPSMAQLAQMSTDAFEDFYFSVCNMNYQKMSLAMEPLVKRMEATDLVEIKGNGTDLRFSIKGMKALKCGGEVNIPDGEVFTAPVRDSVQGYIQYNTKTEYFGTVFDQVYLAFKDGKIITAKSNNSDRLNQILDTDEGARYIGEFAIGVNPFILEPMLDTLFDEKICGSFHFTPGNAYDEVDNGNKSKVHWDLVNIQRTEHGGGEIYFDGELIRKDGLFVVDDLIGLNPDFLR